MRLLPLPKESGAKIVRAQTQQLSADDFIDAEYTITDGGRRRPDATPPEGEPENIPPSVDDSPNTETSSWWNWLRVSVGGAGWILAVAALVVVAIMHFFPGNGEEGNGEVRVASTTSTTIIVGREWSEPVAVPLGTGLRWAAERSDAAFQVRSGSGEPISFPQESYKQLPDGRQVSFRSLETGSVAIQIGFIPLQ